MSLWPAFSRFSFFSPVILSAAPALHIIEDRSYPATHSSPLHILRNPRPNCLSACLSVRLTFVCLSVFLFVCARLPGPRLDCPSDRMTCFLPAVVSCMYQDCMHRSMKYLKGKNMNSQLGQNEIQTVQQRHTRLMQFSCIFHTRINSLRTGNVLGGKY